MPTEKCKVKIIIKSVLRTVRVLISATGQRKSIDAVTSNKNLWAHKHTLMKKGQESLVIRYHVNNWEGKRRNIALCYLMWHSSG